jgi:hypothetical protein
METKPKVKCEKCGKECTNLGAHMRFCKGSSDSVDKKDPVFVAKTTPNTSKRIVLINSSGKEVPQEDYFYKGVVAPGFEKTCGAPVDREDILSVFNKVFKPLDNFLFYKAVGMEVYLVIVPIKYSKSVGESNNSLEGDFQKHAISFLNEGSVNLDTLRMKLERIPRFCNFDDR